MFSKKFIPSEVKYGLFYIPAEYRGMFPDGGEDVTVSIDGKEYHKRMHKKYPRIDGLTKIHKGYGTSIEDSISFDEIRDGYIKVSIQKDAPGKWTKKEYDDWLEESYPMNGEEIAIALNYSRQNVSQLLKRSLSKCYLHLAKTEKDMTPFEIAALMSKMFNVGVDPEDSNEAEVRKFFKLFPANIRRKIKKDAAERIGIM